MNASPDRYGIGRRTSVLVTFLWVLGLAGAALAQPDPAADQMDFADGLFQRGLYGEAAKEYRTYLERYPRGAEAPVARYRLGEAEYAAGNHAAALEALDGFLASGASGDLRLRAQLRKGEVLYRLKKAPEAVAVLEPLAKEGTAESVRVPALYYLGRANHDAGRLREAQTALKTLVEKHPGSALTPFARYQLAYVYLGLNEFENAASEFSNVAGSAEADDALRMECRFRAAEAYDKLGWHEPALQAYEQLRRDFPDSEYAGKAAAGYAGSLYRAGRFEEARAAAAEYLKRYPDAESAAAMRFLTAACLEQEKRYDEAVAAYRRVLQEGGASEFVSRARYKIAWSLYRAGKTQEAQAEAARFLQEHADSPLAGDAAFLSGVILEAEKDYAGALPRFLNVAEKYPQSEFAPEALFKAAECLNRLGRLEEASQAYERFVQRYRDHALAEEAILRAGDAAFARSSYETAVARYKEILEFVPGPATEEETLYRLALAHHNLQDAKASAEAFGKLVEKYPDSTHAAEAHLRIGDYLLSEGKDPLKAVTAYEEAQRRDKSGPLAAAILRGLALARYEAKDQDGAAEVFLKLMSEHPEVSLGDKTYAWVGERFLEQKKWNEAALAFETLLKRNPDYAEADTVRLKLAEAREASGAVDEALKHYRALAESGGAELSAEARFQLAQALEAAGKGEEAVKLYEETARTGTGERAVRARFRLGELAEARGDFAAAAGEYMRVAILFLHEELSPESLWRAGQCYEKAKQAEPARKAYQELVKDYPESEPAQKARQRLTELGA